MGSSVLGVPYGAGFMWGVVLGVPYGAGYIVWIVRSREHVQGWATQV